MEFNPSLTLLYLVIGGAATLICRFLPFLVFRGRAIPDWVSYLGKVLPMAVMCVLVMYCVRDISFQSIQGFLPYCICLALVAGLQIWKRSTALSIVCGTVCYMLLIRIL